MKRTPTVHATPRWRPAQDLIAPCRCPLALLSILLAPAASAQEAPVWSDVGALFAERCIVCHSGEGAPLGLHLDSYAGAITGSENGPVLVPGDVSGSELARRVRGESEPRMPLVGDPLAAGEIAMIELWIEAGLPEGELAVAEPSPHEAEPAPGVGMQAEPPGPGESVTFAQVERIFLQRCVVCHSDANAEGPPEGLRLDSYENILGGGERVAVLPGNPDASEIVRRIEGTAQPRMPLNGPPWLTEGQIWLIRQWIEEGAPDAEGLPAAIPVGREVRFRGLLTGPFEIDGVEFRVTSGTRIDDRPSVGDSAELRGVVDEGGSITATRLRDR